MVFFMIVLLVNPSSPVSGIMQGIPLSITIEDICYPLVEMLLPVMFGTGSTNFVPKPDALFQA